MPADDLNESALEDMVIELEDAPKGVQFHYDPLSTPCDLCIVAVEAAIAQMGNPEVSSDLYVSEVLATDGWAERLLGELPQRLHVTRLRVRSELKPHEWFVECATGDRVGSNPA
jgi:hypothetical protein